MQKRSKEQIRKREECVEKLIQGRAEPRALKGRKKGGKQSGSYCSLAFS